MNRKLHLVIGCLMLLSVCFPFANAISQTPAQSETSNPIDKIMKDSNGNITIDIPESLMEMVLFTQTGKKAEKELKSGINKMGGYRIQVFSDGRNQSTLESRAKARGNLILSKFPKYKGQVYSFSNAPNWFTRVGNFRTIAEANSALSELKKAFPGFASEMRVVKSQIIVIK